jgi:hypothetical protein
MTIISFMPDSTLSLSTLLTAHKATHSLPSCVSHGWSMVASAPTNSTFAGLLAGFVFTGVTILITRPGPRNTQALGLLSCAFVVLGFDSYLFSLVAGAASDTDCSRVWAEGIPSSGMLAVGGLAVVTGISWLLAATGEQSAEVAGVNGSTIRLDSLSRVMAHGVAFAVALLLAATLIDYGQFAFGGRAGFALGVTSIVSTAIVLVASLSMTIARHFSSDERTEIIPTVAFKLSTYGLLLYAVATTIFVGYTTNLTASQPAISVIAVILGLIAPSVLLIGLVESVAPLARPPENQSSKPSEKVGWFRRRRDSSGDVPQARPWRGPPVATSGDVSTDVAPSS